MAEPLTRDGAIPALEDAVRLLRQASLSTLVCHWVGSAPYALALLRVWNWHYVTNPLTAPPTAAVDAFFLALLLIWMNCWRAIFAGRLRRQLSGPASVNAPWSASRVLNLAAGQAFFGATKLVMIPLAVLILFPLASIVAFYRNTAVLGDREDLDPLQLMARARQLAGLHRRQSWALLPLLAFFYLLVAINLGITLAVLPQLVRMLTGYESVFSRSGYFFAFNPLFFLLVIAVSWIAFDPFIQAVYCVRCFQGESLETGEDLRAGLRQIADARGSDRSRDRQGAVHREQTNPRGQGTSVRALAVALVFLGIVTHSSGAVRPAELEKSVHLAMQSHEYDWRLPVAPASDGKRSWVVRLADRMIASVKSVSGSIREALRRFFRWLRGERPPQPLPGIAPTTSLHWSLYALTGVVVLAAVLIWWRRRRLRGTKVKSATAGLTAVIRLDAADLTPDRLPEEQWLGLAEECLREENFRLALRALYLANLAWLGRREFLTIDAGKTNREYELELRRRARAFPEARGLFGGNVVAFERAWYGLHEVRREDIDEFRGRVDGMKRILPVVEEVAA